jgi:hypothetical protein
LDVAVASTGSASQGRHHCYVQRKCCCWWWQNVV